MRMPWTPTNYPVPKQFTRCDGVIITLLRVNVLIAIRSDIVCEKGSLVAIEGGLLADLRVWHVN